jgi:hypothetical protein
MPRFNVGDHVRILTAYDSHGESIRAQGVIQHVGPRDAWRRLGGTDRIYNHIARDDRAEGGGNLYQGYGLMWICTDDELQLIAPVRPLTPEERCALIVNRPQATRYGPFKPIAKRLPA